MGIYNKKGLPVFLITFFTMAVNLAFAINCFSKAPSAFYLAVLIINVLLLATNVALFASYIIKLRKADLKDNNVPEKKPKD